MGSFNTTCFASGQTIAPKDRCFVLPIVESHTSKPVELAHGGESFRRYGTTGSVTSPEAFWESFGSFLKATYDDYGNVKLSGNLENRRALVQLFIALAQRAAVVAQGENQYHDVPFDFPTFLAEKAPLLHEIVKAFEEERASAVYPEDDGLFPELVAAWDYVAEAVNEHRLFVADDNGEVLPVDFAIMHAAAYAELEAIDAYVLDAMDKLNIRITPMVYAGQDYSNGFGKLYAEFVQGTRQAVDEERKRR
jgi:hypothetical protein